jgi:hypothetical protein
MEICWQCAGSDFEVFLLHAAHVGTATRMRASSVTIAKYVLMHQI